MARASLETRLIVFSEMVSSKVLLFKVRIWKKEKYNMFYYIKELAAVFDRVSSTYHIPTAVEPIPHANQQQSTVVVNISLNS